MARVTITNLQTQAYMIPAPIRKRLLAGETRVFDRVFLPDLEKSVAFQTAKADGVFLAVIAEDPAIEDTFEVGSQSVTPISNNAVTTAKINNLAVTTAKINDLAVTTGKLDDLSVTSGKIAALAVIAGKIGPLAVTGAEIAASTIAASKLRMFVSTVQTGTGAAQNVAHGLSVVPSVVIIIPVGGHDGAGAAGTQFPTIVEGVHTGTNVVVTVSNGATFKVFAMV